MVTVSDADVDRIVAVIATQFPSFGKGSPPPSNMNPLEIWLQDAPAQFALGVEIAPVVRAVLACVQAERQELLDAVNGLIGLVQLVQAGRPDLRLSQNHRYVDALALAERIEKGGA